MMAASMTNPTLRGETSYIGVSSGVLIVKWAQHKYLGSLMRRSRSCGD
jgi:hypothetical protein